MARATVGALDFLPPPQTKVGPFLIGTPLGSTASSFFFLAGFSDFGALSVVFSAISFFRGLFSGYCFYRLLGLGLLPINLVDINPGLSCVVRVIAWL